MAQHDLADVEQVSGAAPGGAAAGRGVRLGADGAWVIVDSADVLEVMEPSRAVRLPGAPAEVLGIVGRRGAPLTVVDLGRAMGRRPAADLAGHRLVVVRWRDAEVGLAVEEVVLGGGEPSEPSSPLGLESLLAPVF